MNRKERRKQGKKEEVKTYNLSLDQIEKIKSDAVERAVDEAVKRMVPMEAYISVMVLRDVFGFGKTRINRFMKAHTDLLDSIEKNYVEYMDLVETVAEETGYRYEF